MDVVMTLPNEVADLEGETVVPENLDSEQYWRNLWPYKANLKCSKCHKRTQAPKLKWFLKDVCCTS